MTGSHLKLWCSQEEVRMWPHRATSRLETTILITSQKKNSPSNQACHRATILATPVLILLGLGILSHYLSGHSFYFTAFWKHDGSDSLKSVTWKLGIRHFKLGRKQTCESVTSTFNLDFGIRHFKFVNRSLFLNLEPVTSNLGTATLNAEWWNVDTVTSNLV